MFKAGRLSASSGVELPSRHYTQIGDTVRSFPLFTEAELAAAFHLLLPASDARRWAAEWFLLFADEGDLDEAERYTLRTAGRLRDVNDRGRSRALLAKEAPQLPMAADGIATDLGRMSNAVRGEFLMRLSDFVLDLAAASSPSVAERVRHARGDDERHSRARIARMQEIVRLAGPSGP